VDDDITARPFPRSTDCLEVRAKAKWEIRRWHPLLQSCLALNERELPYLNLFGQLNRDLNGANWRVSGLSKKPTIYKRRGRVRASRTSATSGISEPNCDWERNTSRALNVFCMAYWLRNDISDRASTTTAQISPALAAGPHPQRNGLGSCRTLAVLMILKPAAGVGMPLRFVHPWPTQAWVEPGNRRRYDLHAWAGGVTCRGWLAGRSESQRHGGHRSIATMPLANLLEIHP